MIAHRFLEPESARDQLVGSAPFLVQSVDDALAATASALGRYPSERRRQALSDTFRLNLATILDSTLMPAGVWAELGQRNSSAVMLDDGRARVRVLKRPMRGGFRASSNRRKEEFGQRQQLRLWEDEQIAGEWEMATVINLILQWEITAAGPAMQLVLPETVDSKSGLVVERWQIWLPSAIDLVDVVEYGRPMTEDEELDEYVRRIDLAASDEDGDGPA